ncbi:MAG: hypothetical protein EPN37_10725 [Chitinophagaceae bacterium]|nr:MAG: hypothetical protein EPN37_10725 [Chitinophagaceae bacterium]
MAEQNSSHIEKNEGELHSLDFKSLRQHGIELIQRLSGHAWTDYNLHDPGVTILEILCVAITDLAYRTDFPIQDLLADEYGNIQSKENSFFLREEILTTNPVTINDIRKSILDAIEDVYNIWLEPVLSSYSSDNVKGLYEIFVQMTKEAATRLDTEADLKEKIKSGVRRSFVSKRNLCEDWVRDIVILNPVRIVISADVRVSEETIPEDILAVIYRELEDFLNEPIKYYSEKELAAAGLTVEEIYAGPLLKKGIVPDAQMHDRRREIDPDELIRKIMQIPGVVNVKNFILQTPEGNTSSQPYKLDKFQFAYLNVNPAETSIRVMKGGNEIMIDMGTFNDLYFRKREISRRTFLSSFHLTEHNELLKGTHKNIEQYYTIQNYFPLIYGIGEEGLSAHETSVRKAQAKQLKSYLMLFEQLLANYLSQLANGKNLFSTDLSGKGNITYYFQPLYGIPEVRDLLKAFTDIKNENADTVWEAFKKNKDNEYISSLKESLETNDIYRERKNRVFDHLLARFNLQPDTYPVNLFKLLYGDPTNDQRADEVLQWKSELISNRVELSRDRIKAFDYLAEEGTVQNYSGFQKNMATLLYIRNQKMRPLSWLFDLKRTEFGETLNIHNLVQRNRYTKEDQNRTGDKSEPVHSYDFGEQVTSAFKYGTDINNFQIAEDTGGGGNYSILYKAPQKKDWTPISNNYPDKSSAIAALKELINYLIQINIESEGFHIVEHILLIPPLKSQSFGFGFYENEDSLLFRNIRWTDFDEREKLIGEILEIAENKENTPRLNEMMLFPKRNKSSSPDISEMNDDSKLENALENVRLRNGRKTLFFPRFELWVKLLNGTVMKGDYFNFRMAVILPAWPARFQNENFREFTENLFRQNAPAYIRIDFYWLTISEMKEFEKLYFEWLNFLNKQEINFEGSTFSERLIIFLQGNNYRVADS